MKKISILFIATMLVMSMSFASCSKTSGSKMKTAVDSLSYAYGVGMGDNLAKNLEQLPTKINVDLFLAVFEKALKNDTAKLAISVDQAYDVFQRCLASVQKEAAAKNKEDGSKFLEKNKKASGVITTASGLQYQVIKEGTGAKPNAESNVKVNYHGTLLDGKVFDSSVDRGEPVIFKLDRVIPGWTEGIQLMGVGAKYKFWIPADLAYGDQGNQGIEPGSVLIFEVDLLEIMPEAPAAQ